MSDVRPKRQRGALVVGASSGVGRSIATKLASDGWAVVIAARDLDELNSIATDLNLRHGTEVTPIAVDLTDGGEVSAAFVEEARSLLPALDAVLIPAGTIAASDQGTSDWHTTEQLIASNFTGVMLVAGRSVAIMEDQGSGTLVLFSSIAAAVPRRRNVAYAAAKAGLETFARSMRHRLEGSGVIVQLYALGYVDTAMNSGLDLRLPAANPDHVARRIVDGLGNKPGKFYEPRFWRPIVFALRSLPWSVYRRLDF